jgi:hypothetical protein
LKSKHSRGFLVDDSAEMSLAFHMNDDNESGLLSRDDVIEAVLDEKRLL